MRRLVPALAWLLASTAPAAATTWTFDFTARIDGANLRDAAEAALVSVGGTLDGRFSYSDPSSDPFGRAGVFAPGTEALEISTPTGYSLALGTRIASFSTTGGVSSFTIQSFVSEEPNGWNMFVDVIATGWPDSGATLPTAFPERFDSAYVSAYFLDEFDTIQSIDATILSIAPAAVPLPWTGALLFGGLLLGWGATRRRTRA